MLSPYIINPNNTKKRKKMASNTNFDNNSHPNADVKNFRLTSIDLKPTSNESVKNQKSKLKSGRIAEINVQYLDQILDNNNM